MASGTIALAAALVLALTAMATAIGQGLTASKAMDAIARQPEHVDEGVVEQFGAAHVDHRVVGCEVHVGVGVAVGDEVGEGGGVGVPIAAAAIFEERDGGLGVEKYEVRTKN